MSTGIDTASPQSPLELAGGFDFYQGEIRAQVVSKLQQMLGGDIADFDRTLNAEERTGALRKGLLGILGGEVQDPFTWDNIQRIQSAVDLYVLDILREGIEPHLTEGEPGAPLGLFVDESGDCLDRRSGQCIQLSLEAIRESDEIIAAREQVEEERRE